MNDVGLHVRFIDAWANRDSPIFFPDERQTLVDHIYANWDPGALRTVWAYYNTEDDLKLEQFMWQYFKTYSAGSVSVSGPYHTPDHYVWFDRNPSACAVALARKMSSM